MEKNTDKLWIKRLSEGRFTLQLDTDHVLSESSFYTLDEAIDNGKRLLNTYHNGYFLIVDSEDHSKLICGGQFNEKGEIEIINT